MNRPMVTLDEVCSRITDGTHQSPTWVESGVPFIFVSNIKSRSISLDTSKFISSEEYEKLTQRTPIEIGDVLYTVVGSYGKPAMVRNSQPFAFQRHVAHLKPNRDLLDPEYLELILEAPEVKRQADERVTGVAQKTLILRELRSLQIPLPPLAEQKRIAGILDAADALRAKRRESLAQLDALLQSTFLHLFGDPVTNPMGWERRPLGEITSIDAPMIDPQKTEYANLLHYGPDRIEKETGELLPALTAEQDGLISGKFLCSPGEILYSKIRPYLNKVALVRERCLCSADVYPVRPDGEVLTKEYLWLLLRSGAFLDYVAGFSRRANIPKLNRKQFSGYQAPLPPLDLQHRFARIVESVERQKERLRGHLAELDALFASLQHRAFRGEL